MSEKITNVCKACGKSFSGRAYPNCLCQSCYNYYRKGGIDNFLPQAGRILRDYRGYVICHECGRAYIRLGSHIKESHGMTIKEYKRKYDLCDNCKTTEEAYSSHMRTLALENHMDDMLKVVGRETQIHKGENDKRKGKRVRLQEKYEKAARCSRSKVHSENIH